MVVARIPLLLSGMLSLSENFTVKALIQGLIYVAAIGGVVVYVTRKDTTLRVDSLRMTAITNYIVRAAFWAVFPARGVSAAYALKEPARSPWKTRLLCVESSPLPE